MNVIALTVSTNYSDLLPYVIRQNIGFFKKWIFVTDKNDTATINYLSQYSNVMILYWDFKNAGRSFDKGGAICAAQRVAYDLYPDDWYLILDSDICLSRKFRNVVQGKDKLNNKAIYGALRRWDYNKLSDYLYERNYFEYPWGDQLQGYFQLYKQHKFYHASKDAAGCDLEFLSQFTERSFFSDFVCHHLGHRGNWTGRTLGVDFEIDSPSGLKSIALSKIYKLFSRY